VCRKQIEEQVLLLLSSKSKQVSFDRRLSGPCFRQEGGKGFKDRKNNLIQVFRQDRVPWQDTVLLKTVTRPISSMLFLNYLPILNTAQKKACLEKSV
jgi:hypothetical protein